MHAASCGSHRIARIGNMPTAPDIVRMQNIQPQQPPFGFDNHRNRLRVEKFLSLVIIRQFIYLRKRRPVTYNLIPNLAHRRKVALLVWTHNTLRILILFHGFLRFRLHRPRSAANPARLQSGIDNPNGYKATRPNPLDCEVFRL